MGVDFARRDLKDAHGLLEDARSAGRWCDGAFRDDGPDGIVADATEQVAVGIDDVLES